jgi:2OG-Fe(II) oxygenase superfamily
MLPADGGYIKPHTDAPNKIITLVLSMMRPGEWNDNFGGGTDVLKPRDITRNFNYMNRQFDFDQVEVVSTFPFEPNQCVVFIKTFNSWHAVTPLRGAGSPVMRKTLTINIESK